MKLLVIRHAIAQEREIFATTKKTDDLRPLTADGRRRMARAASGLRALVPRIDLLAASPLKRAQQTARIVAKEYGIEVGETTSALEPDASAAVFAKWLATHAKKDVVAVVGHEPQLSMLVTRLMGGPPDPRVEFKKGGAALLEFASPSVGDGARLLWLQTPKSLRQVGG